MKLTDLQEARYSTTSKDFTNWVKNQIASNVEFVTHPLEDLDDVREAVDDLTNGFGKPNTHDTEVVDKGEREYEYWGWWVPHETNNEYQYLIYVNTSPELFVERVENLNFR